MSKKRHRINPMIDIAGSGKELDWSKKEFVNNSSFLVVDLKQSIPRLFHSHPRIAPTVRVVTVGGCK